jgi:hypothetical protein
VIVVLIASLKKCSNEFLQCFNFSSNIREIFKFHNSKNEITCLRGIKCIAMITIFVTHMGMYRVLNRDTNNEESYYLFKKSLKFLLPSFAYFIEAFFIIKGILLTRSLMKSMKE